MTPDPVFEASRTPSLALVRADLVDRWADGLGLGPVAHEMLSNPRLKDRIVADISGHCGMPGEDDLPGSLDATVIQVLTKSRGQDLLLARLAGCLMNRATVMDWITWNRADGRLGDLNLNLLRQVMCKVDPGRAQIDADLGPDEGLTKEDILSRGLYCLSAWHDTQAESVRLRLSLFAKIPRLIEEISAEERRAQCDLIQGICAAVIEIAP